ncbi:MAG: hypothetical protein V5A38_12880 [Halolamina sp.]|uniref:hypothetical protein n=1 Tax=Halolamina sp. TaxID=1940283 RepID=UPI002FC2978D
MLPDIRTVDVIAPEEPDRGEPEYLFITLGEDADHASATGDFPGGTLETAPRKASVITGTACREIRERVDVEIGNPTLVTSMTFELDKVEPVRPWSSPPWTRDLLEAVVDHGDE